MPKILVRFMRTAGNGKYNKGNVVGLEMGDPKVVDDKGFMVKKEGDFIMSTNPTLGAVEVLKADAAIHYLTPREMLKHGYTEAETKAAAAKLTGDAKDKFDAMVAGETERLETQAATAKRQKEAQASNRV